MRLRTLSSLVWVEVWLELTQAREIKITLKFSGIFSFRNKFTKSVLISFCVSDLLKFAFSFRFPFRSAFGFLFSFRFPFRNETRFVSKRI